MALDFLEKIEEKLEEEPLTKEQQNKARAMNSRHKLKTFKSKLDKKKCLILTKCGSKKRNSLKEVMVIKDKKKIVSVMERKIRAKQSKTAKPPK